MQVLFHIGAHCTDQDKLVRSLLKNRDVLAKAGVQVPGPGRYRKLLSEVMTRLRGEAASHETQQELFDMILDDDQADRLVLANESFLCMASRVIENGELYPRAVKSAWLRNMFPDADVEFAIGFRNPATFLPALYQTQNTDTLTFEDFLTGANPLAMRWSDVIATVQDINPGCPIIAWCDEDTPTLWPEIIRATTGLDPLAPIEGDLDIANRIMTKEGQLRLDTYLKANPPSTESARRKIVTAFLSKFAVEDAIEIEIDVPGWTEDLVDELSENYDDDMERIAALPDVTFLAP